MTHRDRASDLTKDLVKYVRIAAIAGLCAGIGCGSSQGDGPTGAGACSANVHRGQPCNMVASVGTAVTPTCVAGMVPTGTGGTIVDGTYTLMSQTYYGSVCATTPVNATLQIMGGCVQEVTSAAIPLTSSTSYTFAGASVTRTVTCLDLGADAGPVAFDARTDTFTATPTTFTIFIKNSGTSSPNPDRAETYQKR
jgi:hypothetical protein